MRKVFQDLLEGKYTINYTLESIKSMIPRQIKWLNNVPVLREFYYLIKFFWFIVKIIFFAMVIGWFKPQYNHTGAKIVLILITFVLIFFAWRMMNKERDRKDALE